MGVREVRRDLRAFSGPFWLDDDDGVVACDSCGARLDCRQLREQRWVILPAGAGNQLPLCRPCSRRQIGRYATFLMNGRGVGMHAWQWLPALAALVAVAFWGDLVIDRLVVSNKVSALVVGALVAALALGALKLWHFGHMLYLRRRVVAWWQRRGAQPGQGAAAALADVSET